MEDGATHGPDVVGAAAPYLVEHLSRVACERMPGGTVPVQDRSTLSDDPDIAGITAPHAEEVSARIALDGRPQGSVPVDGGSTAPDGGFQVAEPPAAVSRPRQNGVCSDYPHIVVERENLRRAKVLGARCPRSTASPRGRNPGARPGGGREAGIPPGPARRRGRGRPGRNPREHRSGIAPPCAPAGLRCQRCPGRGCAECPRRPHRDGQGPGRDGVAFNLRSGVDESQARISALMSARRGMPSSRDAPAPRRSAVSTWARYQIPWSNAALVAFAGCGLQNTRSLNLGGDHANHHPVGSVA